MRGTDMIKSFKSEDGTYTIEACTSLIAFMLAIMFVYSQVKVLICESILQSAVNNMAKETASYVYVLDRMGLVMEYNEEDLKKLNQLYGQAVNEAGNIEESANEFTSLLNDLFKDDGDLNSKITAVGDISGDASSMVDSIKNIISIAKDVDKNDLQNLVKYSGGTMIKALGNTAMNSYYEWKLSAYLPMEKSKFCSYFMIDEPTLSFGSSRVFPNDDYTILVAVEYDTTSPFKDFPIKRHVVKYAYTAAWVKPNSNQGG